MKIRCPCHRTIGCRSTHTCLPYIMKSHQSRLLPYQVILDCDLLSEEEQTHLAPLTFPASTSDRQLFERIIPSTDFKLTSELLLIDLYHLIFSMTRVVYVKLLANQRHVNKSYKTYDSHSIDCHVRRVPLFQCSCSLWWYSSLSFPVDPIHYPRQT